jgi:hypothetical protein
MIQFSVTIVSEGMAREKDANKHEKSNGNSLIF